MMTFGVDAWAHAAGIPLATATVYVADLVAMGLTVHIADNVFGLTPRGERVLEALVRIPLHKEDAAA